MSKRDRDYDRDYDRGDRGERDYGRERHREREPDRDRHRESSRDYRPPYESNPSYESNSNSNSNDGPAERRRKRKSRWGGDEQEKVFIPGMPTIIPSNLTKEQEESYILQLQIESISRRLMTGDLGIPDNPEERSPSPEPIYNSEGKRLNTREYRTKKKFEDNRHHLIQKMFVINPTYKPPADYKPPQTKICEKVIIPQEEYPDINFVGLIIGPRGNTLKGMERDTSAKIIIRGKGSVKEGKLARKDGQPLPGEDEPLHAFVTGPTHDSVVEAVAKINEVIRKGIELPENQNDLRRSQLRELALLNGTLRENDGPRCTNCGSTTHRSWQCPDKPNVTNNIFCTNCQGAGHLAKDCKEKRNESGPGGNFNNAKIDEEYHSLMAELGEAPPASHHSNHRSHHHSSKYNNNYESSIPIPPPPPPPPQPASEQQQQQQAQQQQQQQEASWHAGNGATAASDSANAEAWANYMSAYGADPYAAYAQMWNGQSAWGAAAPAGDASGKDAGNGVTAAAYASMTSYDSAAQWSQYAQWYASQNAAGNGVASSTASASAASATPAPPPPPPPPSQPSYSAPGPPPPPPPSH